MSLVFVDCEAYGGCPALGRLTEFGAVDFKTKATFHGIIIPKVAPSDSPEPEPSAMNESEYTKKAQEVFREFDKWLTAHVKGRAIMVSDNPAFDFMWICDGFLRYLGRNPFGHSARRISDFYAGLVGDFYKTQNWKSLRITPHDHNPVHDAEGNVQAFERLLKGERP